MKKWMYLVLFALVSFVAKAQDEGDWVIGGDFSIVSTEVKIKSGNESTLWDKEMSFKFLPKIYYFISDNVALGAKIGYQHEKERNSHSTEESIRYDKEGAFVFRPEMFYYVDLGKNFYYRPSVYIEIQTGKIKEETDSQTTDTYGHKTFGGGFVICAFEFKPVEKFGISFSCGNLAYSHHSREWNTDESQSQNRFGLEFNLEPTIGFSYYFK